MMNALLDFDELNNIYLKMLKEGKDHYSDGNISIKKVGIVPPNVPWDEQHVV